MQRQFNPEFLVLARNSRGRTAAWLASRLGVSPGLVSKWENGIAEPPVDRIEQIARELEYPGSLFTQPEHVLGTDSICFHHRKRKTLPARLLNRVEAEMHLAQIQTSRLMRHVSVEASRDLISMDPDENGGPREIARLLRGYWRIPHGPIPNLVTLVEAAGAVVVFREFQTHKLDGMSAWGKGTPPIFFLNKLNPVDKSRWTIAHELGHLVMHHHPTEGDPEEEANVFAQEFLTPRDEIVPDLKRLTFARLPALKQYWRVSMKALITTADKLGALPKSKIKSLYVQYSRAGYNQPNGEPWPLEPESPTVLRDAIGVHLSQHNYTIPELASVVHLTTEEFVDKYDVGGGEQRRLRVVG